MRKPLTSYWSLLGLILFIAATVWSFRTDPLQYNPSHQIRALDIHFFVDNGDFLDIPLLEIAFAEDRYLRREIKMSKKLPGNRVMGRLEIAVPSGHLNAVICAHVRCTNKTHHELELFCGEGKIPAHIAADKIHEITFSTNEACHVEYPQKPHLLATRFSY